MNHTIIYLYISLLLFEYFLTFDQKEKKEFPL
jgi:hypothetical protein